MKLRVGTWSGSPAIRLPAEALAALRVGPGEELDLTIRDGEIRLTAAGQVAMPTLSDILARMERLGPENEAPSVDWGPDRGSEIIEDDYSRGPT
jgi:antitoxin MazE